MNPTSQNCKTLVSKLQKTTADYNSNDQQTLEVIVPVLQVYQELFLSEINFALDNNLHGELWKNVVKVQVSKLENLGKNGAKNSVKNGVGNCVGNGVGNGVGDAIINSGEIQKIIHVIQGYYSSTIEILNQRLNPGNDVNIKFVNDMHGQKYYEGQKEKNAALFLLQDTYVHLGDILRYRSNPDGEQILANGYLQQANFYYKKASEILPSNGQPYNQLAILAFKQKDYFHLIYYWCKALDAKSPFLVSKTNLIRQLERLRGRPDIDVRQSLGTSAPMKKIEIAKKYFLRCFARLYLIPGEQNEFVVSLEDLLHVNKLFIFPVRSNNVGQLFVKTVYLYVWLFEYCPNGATKKVVLDAFMGFVEDMLARQDKFSQSDFDNDFQNGNQTGIQTGNQNVNFNGNQNNKKKQQNSTFDNLLPAIRLSLSWLNCQNDGDKNGKQKFGFFLEKFSVKFTDKFANLQSTSIPDSAVFIEDVEVKGMKVLGCHMDKLKFSENFQVHGMDAESHGKRRGQIYNGLVKFYSREGADRMRVENMAGDLSGNRGGNKAEQGRNNYEKDAGLGAIQEEPRNVAFGQFRGAENKKVSNFGPNMNFQEKSYNPRSNGDNFGQKKADFSGNNYGFNPNNQNNNGFYQNNAGFNQNNTGFNQNNTGSKKNNAGFNQNNTSFNQNNSDFNSYNGFNKSNVQQNQSNYTQNFESPSVQINQPRLEENFKHLQVSDKNSAKTGKNSPGNGTSPFRSPPGFDTPWDHPVASAVHGVTLGQSPNYNSQDSNNQVSHSQASKNSNKIANPFDPIFDNNDGENYNQSQEAIFGDKVRSLWD